MVKVGFLFSQSESKAPSSVFKNPIIFTKYISYHLSYLNIYF